MAPARTDDPLPSFASHTSAPYDGPPRNVKTIAKLDFAENLRPKKYEMLGTHPESRLLFLDVQILDSTGAEPYRGDVLVEHERFKQVGKVDNVNELKVIMTNQSLDGFND